MASGEEFESVLNLRTSAVDGNPPNRYKRLHYVRPQLAEFFSQTYQAYVPQEVLVRQNVKCVPIVALNRARRKEIAPTEALICVPKVSCTVIRRQCRGKKMYFKTQTSQISGKSILQVSHLFRK